MAGGKPSKPISLVKGHRTNAEKQIREEAEKQLYSGVALKESEEVKNNEIAHKEFLRISKLLKAIDKNDDLCGQMINTHCLLVAECKEMEHIKDIYIKNLDEFEDRILDEGIPFTQQIELKIKLQNQILGTDKALMQKRKMLLDIAKENILTIASQLRSIPKKPQEDSEVDPMAKLLGGGRPGR